MLSVPTIFATSGSVIATVGHGGAASAGWFATGTATSFTPPSTPRTTAWFGPWSYWFHWVFWIPHMASLRVGQ